MSAGIFYACLQNDVYDFEKVETIGFDVADARNWFEANAHLLRPNEVLTRSADGTEEVVTRNPVFNWNTAEASRNSEWEVVELPWEYEGVTQIFALAEVWQYAVANNTVPENVIRLVVMQHRRTGATYGFQMRVAPRLCFLLSHGGSLSDNKLLDRDSRLSGVVLFYTLDGLFVNGWAYQNGEIVAELVSKRRISAEEVNAPTTRSSSGCTCGRTDGWCFCWIQTFNDSIQKNPEGEGGNSGGGAPPPIPPANPPTINPPPPPPLPPPPSIPPFNPPTSPPANPPSNPPAGPGWFPPPPLPPSWPGGGNWYDFTPVPPSGGGGGGGSSDSGGSGGSGADTGMPNFWNFPATEIAEIADQPQPQRHICANVAGTRANPLSYMRLAPPNPANIRGATWGRGVRTQFINGVAVPRDHWGIDLAGAVGTPVFAMFDGVVSGVVSEQPNRVNRRYPAGYTGDTDNRGNRIYITSTVNGNTVRIGYWHLQAGNAIAVNPNSMFGLTWQNGDRVRQGDLIGFIGITGLQNNPVVPHLHLSVWENGVNVNPTRFLNATVSTTTTTITTPCD